MTKSSEVLRLAAEYEFLMISCPIREAWCEFGSASVSYSLILHYSDLVDFYKTKYASEHAVMALCLAAAIAESEGD